MTGIDERVPIELYVTCWPTEVGRDDNATADADLRFQVVFSGSVDLWNLPMRQEALAGQTDVKVGVSGLSPDEMRALARFLLSEAGKAEAYLEAYRHASTHPMVSGGAQFRSFYTLREGDRRA